jgi:Mn-dependent DtxR family transcriptional regulator
VSGGHQYLLVLYLAEREDGRQTRLSTGDLAERVGRSPAAATEMVQRLEAKNLVAYEPYDGATLTPEGRDAAEDLYETYVTLSRFFRDVLELDGYEQAARKVAGNVSPAVVDRLATTLLQSDGP